MPYIGNTAGNRFVASQPASVYSGDGSTTVFTLEHSVASDEDILVSVDGVVQEPSVAYAVSNGTTLTFTAAPSSNAGNNIFVYYLFRTVATVDHPATSSLQATDATFTGAFTSRGIDDNADAIAITIDSSENVGIGTTSPSGKLNLATGSGTPCELRLTSNNTGSGAGDRGRIVVYSARNDGTAFEAGKIEIDRSSGTQDKGHFLVATNGGSGVTERLRVTDVGVVNLGTNGTYSGLIVNSTTGGVDSYRATTAGGIHHFKSDVGGTNSLKSYINENGSLISASDYRLKENVVDLQNSLETIKALRPVNFNFKNETELQSGFIAHELKEQISHIVDGDKDQVKEDGSMFIQMVDYSSLIPHLTKALQEATAKIEALEARVTALENA